MNDMTKMSVEELNQKTLRRIEGWRNMDSDTRAAVLEVIREHSAELERRTAVDRKRWVTIRRDGGENDPLAKVEMSYEVDGVSVVVATELLASNFSHGVNLTLVEQGMMHKPLKLKTDRSALIQRAAEADDGSCSTCSPELDQAVVPDGHVMLPGGELRRCHVFSAPIFGLRFTWIDQIERNNPGCSCDNCSALAAKGGGA